MLGILVFFSLVIALRPILRKLSRIQKKRKSEARRPDIGEARQDIGETQPDNDEERDFEELRRIIKGELPAPDVIQRDTE